MTEEAERAVHANAWVPSAPVNLDMDAPQISRQLPSGVQAFRDLAGRYNPRSQARSLAQLQELMQFDFGQEPAGVTDRLIAFERLVGEYETSTGVRFWVYKSNAPFFSGERVPTELRTHLLLTCGSRPGYAIVRQTVGSYSVARRSWQTSQTTSIGEAPMEMDAVYGDKGKKGKQRKEGQGYRQGKAQRKAREQSAV